MSDETVKAATAQAGKLLTQEEIDAIVESRLARERTKSEKALADAKAEAEKAKTDLSATVEKLKTLENAQQTAEERAKLIEEVHAGLLSEVPEDKRGLIPTELTKEQQIRYVQKNKAILLATANAPGSPPPKPQTPGSDKKPEAVNKGELKTLADFPGTPIEQARAWKEWKAKQSQ